jgi:hypothetical protein
MHVGERGGGKGNKLSTPKWHFSNLVHPIHRHTHDHTARGPPLPGLEPPPADPASTTHRAAAPPAPPRVKLVLLGDSGVGKSCLALRLARGEFDPASAVTVGAAFMSTTVPCGGEGRPVRLDVS